eukprot:1056098_1
MAMNRTTINMVIILFTAITISNAQTQWTVVSDPPISSRNYYNKAIGYHNGSIFFLDVSEYHEFNLSNFVITNRGPLAPFVGGTPFGQFSAYIDDTIYWVLSGPYTDPVIGRYNMATNQLTTTWLTTTTTQPDPCLTATDTHLYVLGRLYVNRHVNAKDMTTCTGGGSNQGSDQVRSMINSFDKVTHDLFVTKGDLETSG